MILCQNCGCYIDESGYCEPCDMFTEADTETDEWLDDEQIIVKLHSKHL